MTGERINRWINALLSARREQQQCSSPATAEVRGVSITTRDPSEATSPVVDHLSTGSSTPHRDGPLCNHEGMETCKVCGGRVTVMAFKRTGACCARCLDVLDAEASAQIARLDERRATVAMVEWDLAHA